MPQELPCTLDGQVVRWERGLEWPRAQTLAPPVGEEGAGYVDALGVDALFGVDVRELTDGALHQVGLAAVGSSKKARSASMDAVADAGSSSSSHVPRID